LAVLVLLLRRRWISLVLFTLSSTLIVLPYLIKNFILTGNPVYPFFLPGIFWDATRGYWYSRPGTGLNCFQLILAPWEATIFGVEGGVVEGFPSYGATIGPLLLALIPILILTWSKFSRNAQWVLRSLGIMILINYVQWLILLKYSGLLVQTRLLFPILPLIAICAGASFTSLKWLERRMFNAEFVISALVILSLSLSATASVITFAGQSPLRVILGSQSASEYLAYNLDPYYSAIERINHLDNGARIKFLWEPRSYYCNDLIACEPDALLDRWWHLRQQGYDAADTFKVWYAEGVTHVLINWAGVEGVKAEGFDPIAEEDWRELDDFVLDYLLSIEEWDGGYSLYRLASLEDE
jgi:hypothetical protein